MEPEIKLLIDGIDYILIDEDNVVAGWLELEPWYVVRFEGDKIAWWNKRDSKDRAIQDAIRDSLEMEKHQAAYPYVYVAMPEKEFKKYGRI